MWLHNLMYVKTRQNHFGFERLQRERLMHMRIEAVSLDSTIMKAHPDGICAPKKRSPGHR